MVAGELLMQALSLVVGLLGVVGLVAGLAVRS
jgi:hypothetical protein